MSPEGSEPLVDTLGVIGVLATQVAELRLNTLSADGAGGGGRRRVVAGKLGRHGSDLLDLRGRCLCHNDSLEVVINMRQSVSLTEGAIATSKAMSES